MSARKLADWLSTYIYYTKETESAAVFHKWVGISMIASALRKHSYLHLGRLKVFPNLYIVLVAEPGIARKSQSISYGVDILKNPQIGVRICPEAITKEALIQELAQADERDAVYPTAGGFKSGERYSSISIISKEFESFLGQRKENTKMLVFLTDLFDSQEMPWRYKTKHGGQEDIPSVCINILAATTPESLASSLPSTAVGGGLTSRMLFIWADNKEKKIPIPIYTKEMQALKKDLISDLSVIARSPGEYSMTDNCEQNWIRWYNKFEEKSPYRLCKDPSFTGWYSRKPMLILKVAMSLTASQTQEKKIEWVHMTKAIKTIEEIEPLMGSAFTAVGRSDLSPDVSKLIGVIKQHGTISERKLLQILWRDMDASKFDLAAQTARRSGFIKTVNNPKTMETSYEYEVE